MRLFNKAQTQGQDTADLVNNFVVKSEGLTRILEKETEYFRENKVKQAEMLIETKNSLINELEEIKSILLTNPSVLETLPASEKSRLKAANMVLLKASEENFAETSKAQEVNKLILEAVSYAVNQSKMVEGAYGDKGTAYKNNESNPITVSTNV